MLACSVVLSALIAFINARDVPNYVEYPNLWCSRPQKVLFHGKSTLQGCASKCDANSECKVFQFSGDINGEGACYVATECNQYSNGNEFYVYLNKERCDNIADGFKRIILPNSVGSYCSYDYKDVLYNGMNNGKTGKESLGDCIQHCNDNPNCNNVVLATHGDLLLPHSLDKPTSTCFTASRCQGYTGMGSFVTFERINPRGLPSGTGNPTRSPIASRSSARRVSSRGYRAVSGTTRSKRTGTPGTTTKLPIRGTPQPTRSPRSTEGRTPEPTGTPRSTSSTDKTPESTEVPTPGSTSNPPTKSTPAPVVSTDKPFSVLVRGTPRVPNMGLINPDQTRAPTVPRKLKDEGLAFAHQNNGKTNHDYNYITYQEYKYILYGLMVVAFLLCMLLMTILYSVCPKRKGKYELVNQSEATNTNTNTVTDANITIIN